MLCVFFIKMNIAIWKKKFKKKKKIYLFIMYYLFKINFFNLSNKIKWKFNNNKKKKVFLKKNYNFQKSLKAIIGFP